MGVFGLFSDGKKKSAKKTTRALQRVKKKMNKKSKTCEFC